MQDRWRDEEKSKYLHKLPARILIGEDDLVNQMVVRVILEEVGSQVEVVSDGKEVLDVLTREPFDVIFLDVEMPGMDGVETTRQIRTRWTGTGKTIRIYAMTGNLDVSEHQRYREAGMDGCITKPISLEKILSALGLGEYPELVDQKLAENSDFDLEKMTDLQSSLGEDMKEIIQTYLDDVPHLLGILKDMLEAGNSKEIHRIAHSIKSSSGIFGAQRMAAVCLQIEQIAKNEQIPDPAKIACLNTEFQKVETYLKNYL